MSCVVEEMPTEKQSSQIKPNYGYETLGANANNVLMAPIIAWKWRNHVTAYSLKQIK